MNQMSATDARNNFAEALEGVQDKPLQILKNGKSIAVLISPSMYEDLIRAEEELEDLRDIDEIKKSGGDWIGLDQLAKDLGLV